MTESDDNRPPAGTVAPARIRKAACGIRFDEDELQQGIDFSGAADLKPEDSGETHSIHHKQRKQDRPS
ncbi:hypothetical protein [Marinobacter sp.]|uniref:hypothetical protein n=1 Tax=Marinobacter sp. TaxID=50741 RepID=UPI0025BAA700|nr:hypothetical protein [Marinobacter sp.]